MCIIGVRSVRLRSTGVRASTGIVAVAGMRAGVAPAIRSATLPFLEAIDHA
jgi:hypothetical protein